MRELSPFSVSLKGCPNAGVNGTLSVMDVRGMAHHPERNRMKVCIKSILMLAALSLVSLACVSEEKIDKARFAELDRIAGEMKTALAGDSSCDVPEAQEQRLAAAIAAVKDKAASRKEHDLVNAYEHLLAIYRDGLLLCRSRSQLTHFGLFPKGRIYISQELDSLVERYHLTVEKHVYKATGQEMKSVDSSSIQIIWESALEQIRVIENALKFS